MTFASCLSPGFILLSYFRLAEVAMEPMVFILVVPAVQGNLILINELCCYHFQKILLGFPPFVAERFLFL